MPNAKNKKGFTLNLFRVTLGIFLNPLTGTNVCLGMKWTATMRNIS